MSRAEIRDGVVAQLIAIAPEVEEGDLSDGELLRDQVDLDSMDWLNFLVALHKRFDVEIPEVGVRIAAHDRRPRVTSTRIARLRRWPCCRPSCCAIPPRAERHLRSDRRMVCTSLSDGGAELLGQRRGLDAYLENGKTMGIPILYPWANRLSANAYPVDGGAVTLTPGVGGVRADEHGLPIHGVLSAYPGWLVTAQSENRLTADLDFAVSPGCWLSFPLPHLLTLDVTLADRALTVRTTVTPTTAAAVPLCFGFHPYLTILGVARRNGHCRPGAAAPARGRPWHPPGKSTAARILGCATTRPSMTASMRVVQGGVRAAGGTGVSRWCSTRVPGGTDLRAGHRGRGGDRTDGRAHHLTAGGYRAVSGPAHGVGVQHPGALIQNSRTGYSTLCASSD
jgi:acyl carrier protein